MARDCVFGIVGMIAWACSSLTSEAATLSGCVRDGEGKPVVGAVVAIRTAGPKVGTAVLCPSCYVDCAKRATTDANGTYTLDNLDASLKFTVVAVADGFTPRHTDKQFDPQAGPLDFALARRPSVPDEQLFRFKVVDGNGTPIVHAMFDPESWGEASGGGGSGASVSEFAEPVAVSGSDGVLTFATLKPGVLIGGELSARGYATARLVIGSDEAIKRHRFMTISIRSGYQVQRPIADEPLPAVVLRRGATIVGRMHRADGSPAVGVPAQIVDSDRQAGEFMGWFDIATDAGGYFRFDNVPIGRKWEVYARMGSVGVSPKCLTEESVDEKTITVPDLTLERGHRVSGRVVLSDGKPIPPGIRLMIGREGTWDTQSVELPADGAFTFDAVPKGELVALTARVKGYRVQTDDPMAALMRSPYTGIVDSDVGNITITFEPGENPPFPSGVDQGNALDRAVKWEKLSLSRLGR